MESCKKLYVDGLNFSGRLGFVKQTWNLDVMEKGVKRFVSACRNSGWEPTIFIDAGIESGEALAKWKSRREKEVLDAVKDVPHALNSLMGDMFRTLGVTVYYSPWNADNDDCLAYFAQRDGASVLSNDIDLARYVGKTYEQFGGFDYGLCLEVNQESLVLIPKKIDERRLPTPRELLKVEPKMVSKHPGFVYLRESGKYVRGSPWFATKFYGNLHGEIEHLRHLLYKNMGLLHVEESWPEYDDEVIAPSVKWVVRNWYDNDNHEEDNQILSIENCYDFSRDRIMGNVLHVPNFTPSEKYNLEMSIILVIAEIYAAIHDTTTLEGAKNLLTHARKTHRWIQSPDVDFEADVPSVCRNWKSDGVCKFGTKCIATTGHFNCTCWRGEVCRYRHEK